MHVWMPNIRGNSGSDVFFERLADGLRNRGVEVTLQWFDSRFEYFPEALAVHRLPKGVDIIHANGLNAFPFRRHGLPIVVSEHHYVLDPAYRPYKSTAQHIYQVLVTGRASQRSFAAATVLVSPSHFTERVLRSVAPHTAQAMIHLWVDLEQFSPAADVIFEERRGAPFRILFVGNTSFRKGADVIPRLADRLGSGFEIMCTGGLRGGSQAVGDGSIRHLGRLTTDELVRAYRESDVVLVPSRYEGFGYAALEAMACGKPVVAFACGAVDEIVVNGSTGFLVPVGDVDGLERAVRDIESDAELARSMGHAGRERAETCFSEARGISAYLQLYRGLLHPEAAI